MVSSVGSRLLSRKSVPNRVDIVNPDLCDRVLARLAPSLTGIRDIIDVNPGRSVFSQKLHELVRPRNHFLVEPDSHSYDFGTRVSLEDVFHTELDSRRLLVVANLTNTKTFGSKRTPILHYLSGILSPQNTLHHYGPVRMLAWVHDRTKLGLHPRSVLSRGKLAARVETACEVIEIAGDPREVRAKPYFLRYESYDRLGRSGPAPIPEWYELEPGPAALEQLRALPTHTSEQAEMLRGGPRFDMLHSAFQSRLRAHARAVKMAGGSLPGRRDLQIRAEGIADDIRAFRADPPLLQWDRRPFEPLEVVESDFKPASSLALLDLTPRPAFIEALSTFEARVCFGYVCRVLFQLPTHTLGERLQALVGDVDTFLARSSLEVDLGDRVRIVSADVLLAIARALETWPFRLSTVEMMVAGSGLKSD